MKKSALRLFCVLTSFALCSCSSDEILPEESTGTKKINEWIYEVMSTNYYWYQDLPEESDLDFTEDPSDFFYSLLSEKDGVYSDKKKVLFSSIKQTVSTSTKAIAGTNTYGFNFATYKNQAGKYYAWILYVLPGSPADKAGLKRGDWIIGENSSTPNITNYNELLSGEATNFTMANYENGGFVTKGTISIEASRVCEASPILKDTIYSGTYKNIAYLMYCNFSSGPNDNSDESYDAELKKIFQKFKTKNVTDLVLDLRYNSGGKLASSQLLSSMIAPTTALGKTFCKLIYNDKLTNSNTTMNFLESSKISSYNLNLKRIVVLTGSVTASASEVLINCLSPYMGSDKIYLVGQKTVGKTVGTQTFGENDIHGWQIKPVVFKIQNKEGKADYESGYKPNVTVSELDKDIGLLPLGDTNDPLIKEGLSWLTGTKTKAASYGEPASFNGLQFVGYCFCDEHEDGVIVDTIK